MVTGGWGGWMRGDRAIRKAHLLSPCNTKIVCPVVVNGCVGFVMGCMGFMAGCLHGLACV